MATTTSAVQTVLVTLRDQLRLRPGLDRVTVLALPGKPEDLGREHLVLATEIPSEQSYPFTSNNTKHESFNLNGAVGVVMPGAREDAALDTMARAMAILGELEACLREDPRIGGTALVSEMTEFTHTPGVTDVGRYHEITFTVRVQARLVSS